MKYDMHLVKKISHKNLRMIYFLVRFSGRQSEYVVGGGMWHIKPEIFDVFEGSLDGIELMLACICVQVCKKVRRSYFIYLDLSPLKLNDR